jgi:hypothetical protein
MFNGFGPRGNMMILYAIENLNQFFNVIGVPNEIVNLNTPVSTGLNVRNVTAIRD